MPPALLQDPREGEWWLLGHGVRPCEPGPPGGKAPPLLCVAFLAWGRRRAGPQALNPKAGSLRPAALGVGDNQRPPGSSSHSPPGRALHGCVCLHANARVSSHPQEQCWGAGPPFSPSPVPSADFSARKDAEPLPLERKGRPAQNPLCAASPSPSNSCRKTPLSPGLSLTPTASAPVGTVTHSTSSEHQPPVPIPTTEALHPEAPEPPIYPPLQQGCGQAGNSQRPPVSPTSSRHPTSFYLHAQTQIQQGRPR